MSDFDELKRLYFDYMLNTKKPDRVDLLKLFTPDQLTYLEADADTEKKIVAAKLDRDKTKNDSIAYKFKDLLELREQAKNVLLEILSDPAHPKRYDAAKLMYSADESFLKSHGKAKGEVEGGDGKENFTPIQITVTSE